MSRALERLDRLDALAPVGETVLWPEELRRNASPRDWSPSGSRRLRATRVDPRPWWKRHPQLGGVVVVLVVVAAALGPSNLARLFPARAERGPGAAAVPPAGVDASDERVLPAVTVAEPAAGTYAFMQTQTDGSGPVTFDPCRPIHYVVRGARDAGSRAVVDDAVQTVSAATGLKFVSDGSTDEAPSEQRDAFQPDRYGDRWAPVLIAWSDPREMPKLADRVVGLGGGRPWRDTHGHLTYVTGTVWLDTPALSPSLADPDGRVKVRGVVMHELAHVLGAAHVSDPNQLMFDGEHAPASYVPRTFGTLGAGDRMALATLGNGECAPGL